MIQDDLDFGTPSRLQKAFEKFHAENPHVYALFRKYAIMAKQRGFEHFGAAAVFERLRWHLNFETTGEEFKLNNNYRAFYARKLMREYPEFEDFFRIRKQRSEECFDV